MKTKYSLSEIEDLWRLRIEEMNESGMSQRRYAKENGLCRATLSKWMKKLEPSPSESSVSSGFDNNITTEKTWTAANQWLEVLSSPENQYDRRSFSESEDYTYPDKIFSSNTVLLPSDRHDICVQYGAFTVNISHHAGHDLVEFVLRLVAAI